MTTHIQVVELVPGPYRIEIRIEVDQDIADDPGCARVAREIGIFAGAIRDHDPVAVGQDRYVVMQNFQRRTGISGRAKFFVQISDGKLAHGLAGKIDLAHQAWGVGRRACRRGYPPARAKLIR